MSHDVDGVDPAGATRSARRRPRSWVVLVVAYGGLVALSELALYGAFRLGWVHEYFWWRGPLQLIPTLLLAAWFGRRNDRRVVRDHLVRCAVRAPVSGGKPNPWRPGQARLAPGLLTFTRGGPSGVGVSVATEEEFAVDTVTVPQPTPGFAQGLRPVVLTVVGPEARLEVKVPYADAVRLRAELEGDVPGNTA